MQFYQVHTFEVQIVTGFWFFLLVLAPHLVEQQHHQFLSGSIPNQFGKCLERENGTIRGWVFVLGQELDYWAEREPEKMKGRTPGDQWCSVPSAEGSKLLTIC